MEIKHKFFGTFAILCLILSLGMVMAEEVITPEDLLRFENPVERDSVIKNYIPNVDISGFMNSKSELSSEGILTIEKDGVPLTLDTKNLPPELSEIKYNDGYLDFTYENGAKVSIAQGSINNENKLTGIKNGDVNYGDVELDLEEGGNVDVDENGLISFSDKAKVKMGDKEFYVVEGKGSGSVQKLEDGKFRFKGGIITEGGIRTEADTPTTISYGLGAPGDGEGNNLDIKEGAVTGTVREGNVDLESNDPFSVEMDSNVYMAQNEMPSVEKTQKCAEGGGCSHRLNNGANEAFAGEGNKKRRPIMNLAGSGVGGIKKVTRNILASGRNAVRGLFKGRPIRNAVNGVGKVLGNIKIRPLERIGNVVRGIGKLKPGKIVRGAVRGGGGLLSKVKLPRLRNIRLKPFKFISNIGKGRIKFNINNRRQRRRAKWA